MSEPSEFLGDDELVAMIGAKRPSKQIEWLSTNGWKYEINAARRPVVGRIYARLKLAGVKPSTGNATAESWSLDLANVS